MPEFLSLTERQEGFFEGILLMAALLLFFWGFREVWELIKWRLK